MPCNPMDFPGKNTGVGWYFLFQPRNWTQKWNLHLLPWQMNVLPLSHLGSLYIISFSSKSYKLLIILMLAVETKMSRIYWHLITTRFTYYSIYISPVLSDIFTIFIFVIFMTNNIDIGMIPFFMYKRFNLESLRNVVKGTQLVNGRTWAQGWVFPSNSFQPKWSFSVVLLSVNLVCMLRLLPLAAVWNHCRLGGLETETDRLVVLKAGNVKAACRPGCVPCWASRAFSPSPLPDSGGYWRSLASDCAIWSRPPSPQRLLLCVSPFLSLTRTQVIGCRAHPFLPRKGLSSRSLTSLHPQRPFLQIRWCSHFLGICTWHLLGRFSL